MQCPFFILQIGQKRLKCLRPSPSYWSIRVILLPWPVCSPTAGVDAPEVVHTNGFSPKLTYVQAEATARTRWRTKVGCLGERDTLPSCVRFLFSFPPKNCHLCFAWFSSLISSTSLESDIVHESMLHTCFTTSWLPKISRNLHVLVRNGRQTVFWKSSVFLGGISLTIGVFLNRARVIVSILHTFLQKQWFYAHEPTYCFTSCDPLITTSQFQKSAKSTTTRFGVARLSRDGVVAIWRYLNVFPVRGRRIKAVVSSKKVCLYFLLRVAPQLVTTL